MYVFHCISVKTLFDANELVGTVENDDTVTASLPTSPPPLPLMSNNAAYDTGVVNSELRQRTVLAPHSSDNPGTATAILAWHRAIMCPTRPSTRRGMVVLRQFNALGNPHPNRHRDP